MLHFLILLKSICKILVFYAKFAKLSIIFLRAVKLSHNKLSFTDKHFKLDRGFIYINHAFFLLDLGINE